MTVAISKKRDRDALIDQGEDKRLKPDRSVARELARERLHGDLCDAIDNLQASRCLKCLREGADPRIQTLFGNTVWHPAAVKGSAELSHYLIANNIPFETKHLFKALEHKKFSEKTLIAMIRRCPDVEELNEEGFSVLHQTIRLGHHPDVILACIERTRDINHHSRDGNTATNFLFVELEKTLTKNQKRRWAASNAATELALLYPALKKRGGERNPGFIYEWGFLHLGCYFRNRDLVFATLECGEKPEDPSRDGFSATCFLFLNDSGIENRDLLIEFLTYLVKQKLPKNLASLEQIPHYQTCLKAMGDPLHAIIAFVMTCKGVRGQEFLTMDEKHHILCHLRQNPKTWKEFLIRVYQTEAFARAMAISLIEAQSFRDKKITFSKEEAGRLINGLIGWYGDQSRYSKMFAYYFWKRFPSGERLEILITAAPFLSRARFQRELDQKIENSGTHLIIAMLEQLLDNTQDNRHLRILFAIANTLTWAEIIACILRFVKDEKRYNNLLRVLKDFNIDEPPLVDMISCAISLEDGGEIVKSYSQLTATTFLRLLPHFGKGDIDLLQYCDKSAANELIKKKMLLQSNQLVSRILNSPRTLQNIPSEVFWELLRQADIPKHLPEIRGIFQVPKAITNEDLLNTTESYLRNLDSCLLLQCTSLLAGMDLDSVQEGLMKEYEKLKQAEEIWMDDAEGYLLFVFTYLLVKQKRVVKLGCSREAKLNLIKGLTKKRFLQFYSILFHNPEWAAELDADMCVQLDLEMKDGGRARNTWEAFAHGILTKLNNCDYSKPPGFLKERGLDQNVPVMAPSYFNQMEEEGWQPVRWQGRSKVYHRPSDGKYLVHKWQREGESVVELHKDNTRLEMLRAHPLLKSKFPVPQGLVSFRGNLSPEHYTSPTIATAAQNGSKRPTMYSYICEDEDFLIYPHDPRISEADFWKGRKVTTHDLAMLAKDLVIMTVVADLFHNNEPGHTERKDQGSFIPLTGLFRKSFFGEGCGRLTGKWKGIQYNNNRKLSIGDFAELEHLNTLLNPEHPYVKKGKSSIFSKERTRWSDPYPKTVILANYFAEILQVDELVVGARAKELGDLKWTSSRKIQKIARQLTVVPTTLISTYAGISERTTKSYVEKGGVDWITYAKQMGFWMQNNRHGYLPHLKKQKLPDGLYDPSVNVEVAPTSELRGFDEKIGFAINGVDPDLSTVNGPYAITLGVKNRYKVSTDALVMREAIACARLLREKGDKCRILKKKRGYYLASIRLNPRDPRTYLALAKVSKALRNRQEHETCLRHYTALKMQKKAGSGL